MQKIMKDYILTAVFAVLGALSFYFIILICSVCSE